MKEELYAGEYATPQSPTFPVGTYGTSERFGFKKLPQRAGGFLLYYSGRKFTKSPTTPRQVVNL